MELLYSFGIICIKLIQDRFEEYEWLMNSLNQVFNPNYLMEYLFPMVAAFDAVFGAQLLLSIAFGGWWNTMLKWILVEDRPFWWVRETTYYGKGERPVLKPNIYTCETGPGSPSGHCAAAATILILTEMWLSHIIRDARSPRLTALYEKMPAKTIYFIMVSLVGFARMYAGAHFPHQCLVGALMGSFLSPSLCLFITDPFLLRTANSQGTRRAIARHVLMAVAAIGLSVLLGCVYLMLSTDLHWSTRLAFRWCQAAEFINVKSSPIFAIVQSTGSLLGWALAVTPEVSKYRHDTDRNTLVAILSSTLGLYCFKHVQDYIPNRRTPFYALHFALNVARPYVFLRLVPDVAVATHFSRPERHPRQPRSAPPLVTSGGVKRE